MVVTSREAVEFGVRPWLRHSGVDPKKLEFWAVGPATARALRSAGIRRVQSPKAVGSHGLAQTLGPASPRSVIYFRSDAAGPRLARALRSKRHRVTDVVVYRMVSAPPLKLEEQRALRSADVLVVSSPSGLSELHRRIARAKFSDLAKRTPLVVLGALSLRAARAHGFRHVSVAPSTTAQPFTRFLLRELDHARA